MTTPEDHALDVEAAVRARYSAGARERQEALCCPAPSDPGDLSFLPDEVVEKDYGCGDPSRFVREGDVVLDLGSGAGRVCFTAAKRVGPTGRVVGVDVNDDMLEVAERNRPVVAERLGYDACEFRKGRIQDLRLDVARLDARLRERPVAAAADLEALQAEVESWKRDAPLVADESVDLVVSNCVLNLVREGDKRALFSELYRVVKRGGRVAISDIVVDDDLPEAMRNDPELWSGCLSGAFREDLFPKAFEEAGFHAIELESRGERPWRVVDGYEFRSVTVTARKGKEGPCLERNQAVLYRGPWREVLDDDGHRLVRGERIAVCDKTYRILTAAPYADQVVGIPPYVEIPLEDAAPFRCSSGVVRRTPAESKGEAYDRTGAAPDACGTDCC